jgi:hypothetical protein
MNEVDAGRDRATEEEGGGRRFKEDAGARQRPRRRRGVSTINK